MKRSELISLINEIITTRNIELKENIKDMINSKIPLKEKQDLDYNNYNFEETNTREPRSLKNNPEVNKLMETMGKSKASPSASPLYDALADIVQDPNENPIDE